MRSIAPILVEYCSAYATALVRLSQITHQSWLTGLSIVAGIYQYPDQSGTWFWGVRALVQVDEIIS